MKLYILIPYEHDITYNNYMNNYFKMNDWKDSFYKNNINIEFEYILFGSKKIINPNFEEDLLLLTDIQIQPLTKYYNKFIRLFKKENRIVMIYECLLHNNHQWKINYIKDNFAFSFQNSSFDNINSFWIPCYHYQIQHEDYSSNKTKFCCVNPIYRIGNNTNDTGAKKRVLLIKKFCDKNKNIHVYGNKKWAKYISSTNFIGNLPNEEFAGTCGKFDLDFKVRNKCRVSSQYKFNLIFENLFVDYYVTEKLLESLYSNSVVIYYGPPNIEQLYPDLFEEGSGAINGHKYSVDQILRLMTNMNNDEYVLRVNKIK
jgi:hypothetical protein